MTTTDADRHKAYLLFRERVLDRVEIMLDTARKRGYYGHEWLKLYANDGVLSQVRRGSDTTEAPPVKQ